MKWRVSWPVDKDLTIQRAMAQVDLSHQSRSALARTLNRAPETDGRRVVLLPPPRVLALLEGVQKLRTSGMGGIPYHWLCAAERKLLTIHKPDNIVDMVASLENESRRIDL